MKQTHEELNGNMAGGGGGGGGRAPATGMFSRTGGGIHIHMEKPTVTKYLKRSADLMFLFSFDLE